MLHVIGGGEFGGAERYVLNAVRHLDGLGWRCLVACFYPGRLWRELEPEGRAFLLARGLAGFPSLAGVLRRQRPALVHTHGVRGNLFGRTMAAALGIPSVTTVHSLLELDYPRPWQRAVYAALERATLPLARGVAVVSRTLAERLVGDGFPAERIRVIPGGVDTGRFRPDPGAAARLREELGLPDGTRLVGMVARLHPVKGHDLFLRAAARLADDGGEADEARFLIVGSGEAEYRRHLEELARSLLPAGRVLFLGERRDVEAVLAALDVAVVASLYEGFPLAVLEAMACGTPVAAVRVGALPEMVRSGETGLLCERDPAALAGAVGALLRDRALAERCRAGGLRQAREAGVDAFARRLAAFYAEHAAETRAAGPAA